MLWEVDMANENTDKADTTSSVEKVASTDASEQKPGEISQSQSETRTKSEPEKATGPDSSTTQKTNSEKTNSGQKTPEKVSQAEVKQATEGKPGPVAARITRERILAAITQTRRQWPRRYA